MEREDGEVDEVGVEVVKQGSVHLSQCDLAGRCPLVEAGPGAGPGSTTSCLVTRS